MVRQSSQSGGDARVQYGIGKLYHDGHGIPYGRVLAERWYKKAAEQGFTIRRREKLETLQQSKEWNSI